MHYLRTVLRVKKRGFIAVDTHLLVYMSINKINSLIAKLYADETNSLFR